jgi:hypothetical protein
VVEEVGAFQHGVLVGAEARQALGHEVGEQGAASAAVTGSAKAVEGAEVMAEAPLDQRDHLARDLVGREALRFAHQGGLGRRARLSLS